MKNGEHLQVTTEFPVKPSALPPLIASLHEELPLTLPPGAEPSIRRFADSHDLTRREREVVTLICCGYKNENIARALKLSPPTVRFHMRNVHRKTGTSDKLDLVIRIWTDTQHHCTA